jgi:hypothetical protein
VAALKAASLALSTHDITALEQSYTAGALLELPWNAKNQTNPLELADKLKA